MPTPPRLTDSHTLGDSLAEATAATWDLARCTSEPAARLGREVLVAATQVGSPAEAEASVMLTSALRGPVDMGSPSALFQEVGERVSAGVRPLSTTARRAFDFLRTPSLERSGQRAGQTHAKGA